MAAAGDDMERTCGFAERVAMLDTVIRCGDARRPPQVFMTAAQHELGDIRSEPVPPIEWPVHVVAEIRRGVLQREAVEVFRPRHGEWQTEPLAEPSGETDMIGVEM